MLGWTRTEDEDAQLQHLIDHFNQANPTVHVTLELSANYDERLQQAVDQGRLPDILYVDTFHFPILAADGLLRPLLAIETGSNQTNVSQIEDFYPVLRQAFIANGTLYCLPVDFRSLALIYNKRMFATAGLDQPSDEPNNQWQWADLQSAAQELANVKNIRYSDYGLVLDADMSRWLAFFYQAGGTLGQANDILNNPAFQIALDFYTSLLHEGQAIQPRTDSSSWSGEAFRNQRVGMTIEGNWIIPYLAQHSPDLPYGVAPLPSGPAGKATILFSRCYAISIHSQYPTVAALLIDWLLHPQNMQTITDWQEAMPSRSSLRQTWLAEYPKLAPFIEGIDYGQPWQLPIDPTYPPESFLINFNQELQATIDQEISPQEMLENLQK